MMMIPSLFFLSPIPLLSAGVDPAGWKAKQKKKDKIEKKKERKEIMVVVNLTVPRLKSTTNIRSVRTDRPHQMYPDLYTLSSSFIMIPTWTTSISQTHQKSLEKHSIYNAISTKKKGDNKSSTDQLKMGHPPATSDQFFVVVGLSSIYPVTISKSRKLYPSKLT